MANTSVLFNKDYANRKIIVTSQFNAALDVIWDAFTNSATLEKWLAPEPYVAVTKAMVFKEGGYWLYYMISPEGQKHWSISMYKNIGVNKTFEASDAFCDENGIIDTSLPQLEWHFDFSEEDGVIHVETTISLESEEIMRQLLEMKFEEGYRMSLRQLQKLLN